MSNEPKNAYQVLGPVRLQRGDSSLEVSAAKPECLLTVLLVRANQTVSAECLTDELWGEQPPRTARTAMYVYVSQLRKFLDVGSCSPIVTRDCGYQISVDANDLDALVFQRLLRLGRGQLLAGRHEEAAATLGQALSMWRGRALDRVRGGPIVTGAAARLEELRLECLEMLVEAELALGRHRSLVSLLSDLVSAYPLCEVFYEQFMVALARSGRRAEALSVYRRAWEVFHRELGLEPSSALRETQHAVLNDDALSGTAGCRRSAQGWTEPSPYLHPEPWAASAPSDLSSLLQPSSAACSGG